MRILSIETSCDETAVSVVAANGDFPNARYEIVGNALRSQTALHTQYGGVFPSLAKRDHAAVIVDLLTTALTESQAVYTSAEKRLPIKDLLEREDGLAEKLYAFHDAHGVPNIDLIAVTAGPGLEPALWVGVNFAKALASLWSVPIVPVNHLEGHILASLYQQQQIAPVAFPALALLISGGHTEFVLMHDWHRYEKIGQTRDDAVGEAFDKVARLLGLPYPGGPEISRLAQIARNENYQRTLTLTRPMLDSGDLDVSFSGIKTAVRYATTNRSLTDEERAAIAREFEEAVADVLLAKSTHATDLHGIKTFIIGGGVSANRYLRDMFTRRFKTEYPETLLYIPEPQLSTDNSVMIALAGHAHAAEACTPQQVATIRAEGNKQHRAIPLGANPF